MFNGNRGPLVCGLMVEGPLNNMVKGPLNVCGLMVEGL